LATFKRELAPLICPRIAKRLVVKKAMRMILGEQNGEGLLGDAASISQHMFL